MDTAKYHNANILGAISYKYMLLFIKWFNVLSLYLLDNRNISTSIHIF